MSAASALSEHPGRLEKVFLNNIDEVSPNGIYAVNLYTLGVPHTVIVDDYLPMRRISNGRLGFWFAGLGTDGSIWGAILEKAFAKFHGNYLHLSMGHPYLAVRSLYGAPSSSYTHSKMTASVLWQILEAADRNHDVITCSTPSGSHYTQNEVGLARATLTQ